MEKKLRRLFDFQKFEQNEELNKVINETRSKFGEELSLDDLANVAGGKGEYCRCTNKPNK